MSSKTSNSAPLGVRRVERPRPLRSISHTGIPNSSRNGSNITNASSNQRISAQEMSTMEDVVKLLEFITQTLESGNHDKQLVTAIIRLNGALKTQGNNLELFHRGLLDRAQVSLRDACKDTKLDIVARLHILEIIELRSMKWVLNDSVLNYYKQKLSHLDYVPPENSDSTKIPSLNVNAPTFTPSTVRSNGGNILNQLLPNQNTSIVPPGEVMISSGKYSGPTQPHGKSYFKDEVFIRNADSGKVAPGSLDRLVQITGSVPGNVAQAKVLMEETIRRNQSPLPDTFVESTGPNNQFIPVEVPSVNNNNEYRFSVKVGGETLKISSSKLELVKTAKIVLEEHFAKSNASNQQVCVSRQPLFPEANPSLFFLAESEDGRSKIRRANFAKTATKKLLEEPKNENQNKCYDRDFLLSCTDTPASTKSPPNWDKILQDFPELMRKVSDTNQDDLMDSPPSPMIKLPRKIFDPNTGNWTDEPSRA